VCSSDLIENFTKEIMQVFSSAETMFDMEALLVNDKFIKRKDTYNIKEGGSGGFDHINNNLELYEDKIADGRKKGYSKMRERYTDNEWLELQSEKGIKGSIVAKEMYKSGIITNNWLGRHHTEETKQKMSKSNSLNHIGQKNSMYGKCWIYCPYTHESKPIPGYKLKEWEDRGWVKGRKIL
jgi:hypothetical protein